MRKIIIVGLVLFVASCAHLGKVQILESYPQEVPKWFTENISSWDDSDAKYFVGTSEDSLSRDVSSSKAQMNAEQKLVEMIKQKIVTSFDSIMTQEIEKCKYLKENNTEQKKITDEFHSTTDVIQLSGITPVYAYDRKLKEKIRGKTKITWSSSVVVKIKKTVINEALNNINANLKQNLNDKEAKDTCDRIMERLSKEIK